MGFSYAPTARVQSGVERATLVRRTYGLVFLSIIVTILGVAFAEAIAIYALVVAVMIGFVF